MKEPDFEDVLLTAKDEIIAYTKDGTSIKTLRKNLLNT
jgi:hypothetical protein